MQSADHIQGGAQVGFQCLMGDPDDLGIAAGQGALHDTLDADMEITEDAGQAGEDFGAVMGDQPDIIFRPQAIDRQGRLLNVAGTANPTGRTMADIARDFDDIPDHCAASRQAPGAAPVEHDITDGIAP